MRFYLLVLFSGCLGRGCYCQQYGVIAILLRTKRTISRAVG